MTAHQVHYHQARHELRALTPNHKCACGSPVGPYGRCTACHDRQQDRLLELNRRELEDEGSNV